jgi:hypothetical protein
MIWIFFKLMDVPEDPLPVPKSWTWRYLSTIEDYPGGYHAVVMEYYQRCILKYNKDISSK